MDDILVKLFRDSSYDHRKVLNCEDIIKTARQMNHTYDEIAELCNVSKTTISNWGNLNKADKPVYNQLKPMLTAYGRGRFKCQLEPLSPAAIEYKKIYQYIASLFFIAFIGAIIWFVFWEPCESSWGKCKQLPWYKMPSYGMLEGTEEIKAFKDWKLNNKK